MNRRLILTIAPSLFLFACSPCPEQIQGHVESPSKELVLTSVARDCGATTRVGTSVVLRRPDQGWSDSEAAIFVVYGEHSLSTTWIDNTNVMVRCEDCKRDEIIKMLLISGETTISYQLPKVSEAEISATGIGPGVR